MSSFLISNQILDLPVAPAQPRLPTETSNHPRQDRFLRARRMASSRSRAFSTFHSPNSLPLPLFINICTSTFLFLRLLSYRIQVRHVSQSDGSPKPSRLNFCGTTTSPRPAPSASPISSLRTTRPARYSHNYIKPYWKPRTQASSPNSIESNRRRPNPHPKTLRARLVQDRQQCSIRGREGAHRAFCFP